MVAEENEELKENEVVTNDEKQEEMSVENSTNDENENNEDKLAETLVSEGLESSSDEELEAQMAAAIAAEKLDGSEEDGLEAQMVAAMATEESGDISGEDNLETQVAAAKEEGTKMEDDLFDAFPDEDDSSAVPIKDVSFSQFTPSDELVEKDSIDRLLDVGLNLSVELGRKDMKIKEILDLGPGKIIELDKLAGEPVDILVNGKLLAKGEVVVVDENFGVRITELIDPVDRIKMLK